METLTLKETPFSLSPSPSKMLVTPSIASAIHKIQYTVDYRQGLTCILGDVGMGKSTLLRRVYAEYHVRDDARTAYIPQPEYKSEFAFIKAVSEQFKLPPRRSLYSQMRELEIYLTESYKAKLATLVFIDEAQRLGVRMLEQLRVLLNFENESHKFVQFVLAAQLEFRDKLRDARLKPLRSRVSTASLLSALSFEETSLMLEHRCQLSGIPTPFPPPALRRIYEISGGVPRDVMRIAGAAYDLMLLLGATEVDAGLLETAIAERPI